MLSGMLEYIAVFPGGETIPLFVQSTADRIIALMMLPISMYSIHSLALRLISTGMFPGSCLVSIIGLVIQHTIQLPAS